MYRDQWVPNGLFTITSPIIDFNPDAPGIEVDFWNDYNTRIARGMGTNEHFLVFPHDSATIDPFEENAGFVVDDEIVVDGNATGGGNATGE